MAQITTTQLANKILDTLNEFDYRGKWQQTKEFARMLLPTMGITPNLNNVATVRKVFRGLRKAGHVIRRGNKVEFWQISHDAVTNGWDREFPFNASGNAESTAAPLPDDDDAADAPDDDVDLKPAAKPADDAQYNRLDLRVRHLEAENNQIKKELAEKENRLDQIEKMAATASAAVKTLRIENYDGKVHKLHNVILPSYFQTVVDLARCRRNILLVGPAGCGKTTVAELVARTLKLEFGKVGGSSGLTEIHLLGRANQNIAKGTETYRSTEFVRRYEKGGLMLVDELDGADQNVLLALNPALDRTGLLPLPNRLDNPMAKKHKDFVCVATANTFGRGATRIYAGRNQLDGATLDRFAIGTVECYYDLAVEKAVCPDDELRTMLQAIRTRMEEASIRRVMSTRFMEDAFIMKEQAKWTKDQILRAYFEGWTKDEKSKVMAA